MTNVSELAKNLGIHSDDIRHTLRAIPTDVALSLTPEQLEALIRNFDLTMRAVVSDLKEKPVDPDKLKQAYRFGWVDGRQAVINRMDGHIPDDVTSTAEDWWSRTDMAEGQSDV